MATLLDGNVLIALLVTDHVHHEAAGRWFVGAGTVATCPTVQGTPIRFHVRQGTAATRSVASLQTLLSLDRHEQWLDDLTYAQVDLTGVLGHAQVTDAYLAALARARGGRVATLDRAFAAVAPDVVDLVPT